jgi:hypothetical protein
MKRSKNWGVQKSGSAPKAQAQSGQQQKTQSTKKKKILCSKENKARREREGSGPYDQNQTATSLLAQTVIWCGALSNKTCAKIINAVRSHLNEI